MQTNGIDTTTREDTTISEEKDHQSENNNNGDETPELDQPEDDPRLETVRKVGERAREIAYNMAEMMGIENLDVELTGVDRDEARLDIQGDNLGLLIGRHGETIDAMQLVVAIGANKPFEDGARVILDAENYRARHRNMLEDMAREYAEKVKDRGEEAVIPDLKAYERRIVHLALVDDPEVETYSEGEGTDRHLVISPMLDEQ